MKLFSVKIIVSCALLSIFACEKSHENLPKNSNGDHSLNPRTEEEPGEFWISNGMMVFPTDEDFQQTVNYLGANTDSFKNVWRNSFNLETPQKVFSNFTEEWEALGDDDPEGEEDLVEEYEGLIRVLQDEDDEEYYLPKFRVLNEFINMGGLLRVGTTLIKVTDSSVISITRSPQHANHASFDNETVSDTSIGVIVHDLTPRTPDSELLALRKIKSRKICKLI